jgi:type I restriction enzyme S subunit
MEVRRGYRKTDAGVIPEDWEVIAISNIGTLKTGPFGTLLKANEYADHHGTPIVSVRDIGYGVLRVDERTPLISQEVAKRLTEYRLVGGDLVFCRKGAVDRSAIVEQSQSGFLLGSDGIRLRLAQAFFPSYIIAQFQSHRIKSWLLQNAIGTTMPSMNPDILRRIRVPIAPLPEQHAIATVLSDMDDLLAGLDKLIAKKRDLKQAAMQQLLTGKTRLPGFSGEWEVKRLGDVATFFKGKGLPKSALSESGAEPCIHYGELFTRYPETIGNIFSRTDMSEGVFRSVTNDVLMPTSDVTPRGLAKASCIRADGVILGGDILVIRSDKNYIHGPFLSLVIRYEETQVLQLVTGSTVYHLYGSDMKNFTFSMPPLPEQIAIAEVLSDMDAEIASLETRLEKTRALKHGMMQELLTGRIRLV